MTLVVVSLGVWFEIKMVILLGLALAFMCIVVSMVKDKYVYKMEERSSGP